MSIVAGVDFGTLSVRVSIYDRQRGPLGYATASYPLLRSQRDPDFAMQRHTDQLDALILAMREALARSRIDGHQIRSIALDTTGSSPIIVTHNLVPLSDYYLWCDHRASREAAEITAAGRRYRNGQGFEGLAWCGGVYSSEWGWAKLLHWLRHNPNQRSRFVTALEHCDMIAATLCGITESAKVPRSICAMGHKWMWNPRWGGLPPEDFLVSVDPLLAGMRDKITGRFGTSQEIAGHLSEHWAGQLGLAPGIPIPVGALDAHWDAVAANIRLGDVVNVIGTSTCIIGLSERENLVPGVCGVVPGSVAPHLIGIEAGLSAVGDAFHAIAQRAGTTVAELSRSLETMSVGETGLLRLVWDNGDRTVLVNPLLGAVTLGWNLAHTAADELFAAIEGTALQTRIILDRMEEHGTGIRRVMNGGGIPKRNPALNQVYADILNKPVLVQTGDATSLGAVIFAFLAAGEFATLEEAQNALCPPHVEYLPRPDSAELGSELYTLFRRLYFALGTPDADPVALGDILPALRSLRARAQTQRRQQATVQAEQTGSQPSLTMRSQPD